MMSVIFQAGLHRFVINTNPENDNVYYIKKNNKSQTNERIYIM